MVFHVKLHHGDQAEDFRKELATWLDGNWPNEQERGQAKRSSAHLPQWAKRWQQRLFDAGWLVPSWPPELGGRNASASEQMIYFEELASRQIPRSLNPQGLSIIAPSILQYGTDKQRDDYVIPTLRGEMTWCLGMSEPGAGSDLASLQTRAVCSDGHFVVNGQKVWTSGAHDADYCFCFVRTNPDAPKHRGISVLVIDMAAPGVTCRPLPELTHPTHADFNEVFFSDVRVPVQNLIGEQDRGWPITRGSLQNERGMLWITAVTSVEHGVRSLVELAQGRFSSISGDESDGPPAAGSELAHEVARLYIDATAMRALGYRGFAKFARGEDSAEHAILKLFSSEAERRLYLAGTEALGADAIDLNIEGPSDASGWITGSWMLDYFKSFSGTIAGGTSDIQRNIIAERVLGLPR